MQTAPSRSRSGGIPFDSADSYRMIPDGVIDQIGGDKRLSFGKRRLKALEHGDEPLGTLPKGEAGPRRLPGQGKAR